MNIKPLGNRVLIEIKKQENITKSGLIITHKIEGSENFGKIIEISDNIDKSYNLKIGDEVLFDNMKSMEVRRNDKLYYIAELENIYAVMGE